MARRRTQQLAYGACVFALITSTAARAAKPMPRAQGRLSFHHDACGYLGVDFEDLTDQQRAQLQSPLRIQDKQGVAIAAVDQDAPAEAAGLQVRDILLRINNQPAQSALQVRDFLRQMKPGQMVSLTVLQNGRVFEKSVLLANRKDVEQRSWSQHYSVPAPNAVPQGPAAAATSSQSSSQPPAAESTEPSGIWNTTSSEFSKVFGLNGTVMSWIPWTNALYTGVELDAMEPQLAGYFHIQSGTGLLVRSVDANSPGARAGLRAGDVVLKVDDVPMTSRSKWQHVIHANRNSLLLIEIQREAQPATLTMSVHDTK